jgi:hypothetical protein
MPAEPETVTTAGVEATGTTGAFAGDVFMEKSIAPAKVATRLTDLNFSMISSLCIVCPQGAFPLLLIPYSTLKSAVNASRTRGLGNVFSRKNR